jgi:uncharacterized membrane protein (UPF0127 family)
VKTLFLTAVFAMASLSAALAFDPMKSISTGQGDDKIEWVIELASDDASRSKGLMFRKSMQALHGMLFRFEAMRPVSMWMKNTFIPLDMIFMDEQGSVTHIHLGAVPHSLDIISSNGPAKFVLEINAGEAEKQGLRVGQKFLHPWFQAAN